MKQKNPHKLRLAPEMIRVLGIANLAQVVGGGESRNGGCDPQLSKGGCTQ